LELKANVLASSVLINDGKGKFEVRPLPMEAQLAPMFGIEIFDINKDGNLDIIAGGNLYGVKPEVGRYDASYATVLLGDGKGNFEKIPSQQSGVRARGQIRDIHVVPTSSGTLLLMTRNNESVLVYSVQ
jgi:hypothetical protein